MAALRTALADAGFTDAGSADAGSADAVEKNCREADPFDPIGRDGR
ncbi:hypothetical protein ABT154_29730 [Streptomyces sp. NPDC001728]